MMQYSKWPEVAKGCLPLIALSDVHEVISTTEIQFGKNFTRAELFQGYRDQGERIGILYSNLVPPLDSQCRDEVLPHFCPLKRSLLKWERWMDGYSPAAGLPEHNSSMGCCLVRHSGYILLHGGMMPGRRLMAKS